MGGKWPSRTGQLVNSSEGYGLKNALDYLDC
jgi:hypothetical protein